MIKLNKGYSLVVLVILIAVILIITTTAMVSLKNVTQDREISKYMSDIEEVQDAVTNYYASSGTLPVIKDANGDNADYTSELTSLLSANGAQTQLGADDTGAYYEVDISKLGKIHLQDSNRGYILNEKTLNVYTRNFVTYNGVKYFTVTSELRGETNENRPPFKIKATGNPFTWDLYAEIRVEIDNIISGSNPSTWTYKWLEGVHEVDDFTSNGNAFSYDDTLTFEENGTYTIYVKNNNNEALTHKIVISKIDDIPPKVATAQSLGLTTGYKPTDLIIEDAETGMLMIEYGTGYSPAIKCKIISSENYPVTSSMINANPNLYSNVTLSDEGDIRIQKYLGVDPDNQGIMIEEFLARCEEYISAIEEQEDIIASTEDEAVISSARAEIANINSQYPECATSSGQIPNSEKNLALYAEDFAGNQTVYIPVSRADLQRIHIVEADTIIYTGVQINNGAQYTNNRNVTVRIRGGGFSSYAITNDPNSTLSWNSHERSEYDDSYTHPTAYTLSTGDGKKVVYAIFENDANMQIMKSASIIVDTTPPTTNAPSAKYVSGAFNIQCKQTDAVSGIASVEYGMKLQGSANYTWYNSIEAMPTNISESSTYLVVTKATDRVGNVSTSAEATLKFVKFPKVGEYVEYQADHKNTYENPYYPGIVSRPSIADWRIWEIDEDAGTLTIIPASFIDNDVNLKTPSEHNLEFPNLVETACDMYANSLYQVDANAVRSMSWEDIVSKMKPSEQASKRNYFLDTSSNIYFSDLLSCLAEPAQTRLNLIKTNSSNAKPILLSTLAENNKFASVAIVNGSSGRIGGQYTYNSNAYGRIMPMVTLGPDIELDDSDATRDGSTPAKAWRYNIDTPSIAEGMKVGDYVEYEVGNNSYSYSTTTYTPDDVNWRIWRTNPGAGTISIVPATLLSTNVSSPTLTNGIEYANHIEAICDTYANEDGYGVGANSVWSMTVDEIFLNLDNTKSAVDTYRSNFDEGRSVSIKNQLKNYWLNPICPSLLVPGEILNTSSAELIYLSTYWEYNSNTKVIRLNTPNITSASFVSNLSNVRVLPVVTIGPTIKVDESDPTRDGSTSEKAWRYLAP